MSTRMSDPTVSMAAAFPGFSAFAQFLMPRRQRGKKRRGKCRHVRSAEAIARRKAALSAVFKERLHEVC